MKFKDKTRGGYPCRIYATDGSTPWVAHGAVQREDGGWDLQCWGVDGRAVEGGRESPDDLLPLPEPSEAAVEAAIKAREASNPFDVPIRTLIRTILTAGYEIDFPEGGK